LDILKPYIGADININYKDITKDFDEQIRKLKQERTKAILNYHLNLFKNIKFRKNNIKRYMNNIDDLCIDMLVINNIKQAYSRNSKIDKIEIAVENSEYAEFKYSYEKGITKEFDDVYDEMTAITDAYQADNSFSDICSLAYRVPDKQSKFSYFSLVESNFEYEQDFRGEDIYYVEKDYYPIVLQIEKLLNSKSKELKELILKEYNNNEYY